MTNSDTTGRPVYRKSPNETTNRIKSLFNWGELSRMLAGTRAVVLKNKYPKKHEKFIQDLTESTRQVLVRHGHIQPEPEIISVEADEFYAESFTD